MDHRDRLILALSALIRAEREARNAWDSAIAANALAPEIIDAIGDDPKRLIGHEDLELAEAFVSPSSSRSRATARFA
ncbi:hypothetical protein PZ895_01625 [Mesorhizobium sp. YIM 152430]|jgi:hypothetical protein|uniref:hypothetical protein n=1 Tax=Mesorhizobium sp. YIM 152430 TaxID=3031761 RepID=UPI0023DA535B|nr:hypothetical protein [Mesorhizobium sp. YIM 152430]MDF1598472.1 hypothetical protein [Mesorhizobium sp. YIM 152430]